jgi:pimeloyl-ACP methyl ester carboxylesterase
VDGQRKKLRERRTGTAVGSGLREEVNRDAEYILSLKAVITTPACRNKPSWALVAAKDRTINPELERWYAKRAHMVAVAGASHSVYVSHPRKSRMCESAARAVSK